MVNMWVIIKYHFSFKNIFVSQPIVTTNNLLWRVITYVAVKHLTKIAKKSQNINGIVLLQGTYTIHEVLGLFGFKVKYRTHFSFSPITLLNNVFTVLFHYLLPYFRQLHNFIFPKLFIFLSKELFHVSFAVSQGMEFFPFKRIL